MSPSPRLLTAAIALGLAAPAPAVAHMTPRQRAHERSVLLHRIRHHPGLIRSRAFIKRASLVNFKLPVTIVLRQGANPATTNPNVANVDLGTSLGQRTISLGGKVHAEIAFHDSFDGGALGNVGLTVLPGGDITTTSVPLLWNPQVTGPGTHWYAGGGSATAGCSDFTNAAAVPSVGTATTTVGKTLDTPLSTFGFHGAPYFASQANADAFATTGNTALIAGTTEVFPGADDVSLISASRAVGDPNAIGPNDAPFPYSAQSVPGGFSQPPNAQDAVLRTAPLHLHVAPPGTEFAESGPSGAQDGNGPQGSINIVTGKNGGEANLFGVIPGSDTSVFVTLTFETNITSILREVDPDPAGQVSGNPYRSSAFACRQFWTGTVRNVLNDITLAGDLHIAPGITSGGALRIAKVSLQSDDPWDVGLAACLQPYSLFSATAGLPTVPGDLLTGQSATGSSAVNPEPTGVPCNSPATPVVAQSGVPALTPLNDVPSVGADGSQVSVGATITVPDVEADVLIGDV